MKNTFTPEQLYILSKFTQEQQDKINSLFEYNEQEVGSYIMITDVDVQGITSYTLCMIISTSSLEVYFSAEYLGLLLKYILTDFDRLITDSDNTQEKATEL